jgi:hypothetical protein
LFVHRQIVEGGDSSDIDQKLLDIESGRREGLAQLVHYVGTIRKNGLFDNLVKELLDEGAMGVFVVRGVFGDVARAGHFDGFAFVGDVFGDGIDWFAVVLLAEFSDGVEVLQAEAERIDEGMTTLTRFVFRKLGNFLAHGERRVELGVIEGDGHRRRF